MVTGTLSIFLHDVYALVNLGSTLSYVTLLVAEKFKRTPELLVKPFEVSTLIGKSIIARRVYQNCIITICGHDTMADLVELGMLDFDVIMRNYCNFSCCPFMDRIRRRTEVAMGTLRGYPQYPLFTCRYFRLLNIRS